MQLQAAAAKLHSAGIPLSMTPWHNHEVLRAFKQSSVLRPTSTLARARGISALSQTKAAQWRSSSGPGASGFLLIPNGDQQVMDNFLFKISVARRFGGGIRAGAGIVAAPTCAH